MHSAVGVARSSSFHFPCRRGFRGDCMEEVLRESSCYQRGRSAAVPICYELRARRLEHFRSALGQFPAVFFLE